MHRQLTVVSSESCRVHKARQSFRVGQVTSLLGFTSMLETAAEQSGLSQLDLELAQFDKETPFSGIKDSGKGSEGQRRAH